MEANWIEVKHFLNDYKKNIIIGSIVIAILFSVSVFLVGTFKEEVQQEGKEDFEVDSESLLNETQPAYFQIYIEYEDGTSYGNPSIINQYFNLSSIKEKIKKDTGIDIKLIEEEVFLNDLSDEIEIINVTRNDSSYLLTATFNLGNKQDNLTIAEYYYNLLYSEDFSILADKKTYIFQEPMLAKKKEVELDLKKLEEKRKDSDEYSPIKEVLVNLKNVIIGFLLGLVIIIGILLLKVIFGNTLDYSFAYDIDDDDEFILSDKKLKNKEIVSQFVAAPFASSKVILSEKTLDVTDQEKLFENQKVTFRNNEKEKTFLLEMNTLTNLDITENILEVIIIVQPKITTRKWYKDQKQLAYINKLPKKIIQVNR